MDIRVGPSSQMPAPWPPPPVPAQTRGSNAAWWVSGQVLLLVVCIPFLWNASWTQVYFESTNDAVTQASAHHPELVAAWVALVTAVVGGIVQILLKTRRRGRLICLAATSAAIAVLLATGEVATETRLPTVAAIRATVYAVAAPDNVSALPLDAVDRDSSASYPRIVRKWQYGPVFLRSDVARADRTFTRACDAVRMAAPASSGWHEEYGQPGYCSFVRTVAHVRMHYSAMLMPGDLVPGQNQSETVVVYLEGDIASPTNV